jgi:hypothetical protein
MISIGILDGGERSPSIVGIFGFPASNPGIGQGNIQ